VAIAVVAVYVAQLIAVYAILFRRVLGIPVGRMVRDLAPAVLGGLALLAVGFPLAHVLESAGAHPALIVLAVAALGLFAHGLVVRQLFPAVWSDLVNLARRVLPSRLLPTRNTPAGGEVLSARQ
jgi:hypothetical protein